MIMGLPGNLRNFDGASNGNDIENGMEPGYSIKPCLGGTWRCMAVFGHALISQL